MITLFRHQNRQLIVLRVLFFIFIINISIIAVYSQAAATTIATTIISTAQEGSDAVVAEQQHLRGQEPRLIVPLPATTTTKK